MGDGRTLVWVWLGATPTSGGCVDVLGACDDDQLCEWMCICGLAEVVVAAVFLTLSCQGFPESKLGAMQSLDAVAVNRSNRACQLFAGAGAHRQLVLWLGLLKRLPRVSFDDRTDSLSLAVGVPRLHILVGSMQHAALAARDGPATAAARSQWESRGVVVESEGGWLPGWGTVGS